MNSKFCALLSLTFFTGVTVIAQSCRLDSVVSITGNQYSYKSELFYYGDSMIIKSYDYDVSQMNWESDVISKYYVDGNRKLTRKERFTFDPFISSYDSPSYPPEKLTFNYNSLGNFLLRTEEKWLVDSARWENGQKEEFIYDSNLGTTRRILSQWNAVLQQFYPFSLMQETFDSKGVLLVDSSFSYSPVIYNGHTDYHYDQNGLLVSEENNLSLAGKTKKEYNYDTQTGALIEKISSRWNGTSWDFTSIEKYYYGQEDVNAIQWNYSFYNSEIHESFVPKYKLDSIEGYTYNVGSSSWNKVALRQFFYSNCLIQSILDNSKTKITIYPNPNNGHFTINSEAGIQEVQVYSQAGQLLQSEKAASANQSVYELELQQSGVYFLHVFTENSAEVVKVVVVK